MIKLLTAFIFLGQIIDTYSLDLNNPSDFETIWIYNEQIDTLIATMNKLKNLRINTYRLYDSLILLPHYKIYKNSSITVNENHNDMWFLCFINTQDVIYASIAKKGKYCFPIKTNWYQN